jgi:putative aldouronate transport system permease protein
VVNTLRISFLRILFGFPVPIIFALLLNEVTSKGFKRTIQTATYFPHFLSWVVFAGIVFTYIGPTGILNGLIAKAGGQPIDFTTNPRLFLPMIITTGILKEFGWGAIIYLAALSGIDPQLYEAAGMDGASRLRQMWHVSLPGIRNMMALLLTMSIAHVLDAGFDQIYMFLNPTVLSVGDIIDTYVYRIGLLAAKYEFGTAVGLLKGIVSLILIVTANYTIKKMGETSLW